jgi:ubiquinone/menaquinone biosynthesis C-methylase UbiE
MLDVKDAVQKQFNQVAANYSVSSVHARGVDLPEMLKAAQPQGNEQVLDAGCGTGHTALTFAPHVAQVTAVDFSVNMLQQGELLAAERGLTNIKFQRADVEQLPFADQTFDLVVSRYSAHHWPHPQRALREFARVLRPGGRLVLSDIVAPESLVLDTLLQTVELLRDPSHVRDHTVVQWLDRCHAANFVAEVTFTWNLRLDFADWTSRMLTPPERVRAIQSLFDVAPADVRNAFQIEPDYSFSIPGALFLAKLARS